MAISEVPLQTGRMLCCVCGLCHYPFPAGSGPWWGRLAVPCRRCGSTHAYCELVPGSAEEPWRWYVSEAALDHVGLMHYGPLEIRGADELAPGPYWAISCVDAWHRRQWLHLQKKRPVVGGRAVVRWRDDAALPSPWPGASPDAYECRVWGVLVTQRDRRVRQPYARERLAVGDLGAVPCHTRRPGGDR